MFDEPILTRISEYITAELRPRDRTFVGALQGALNQLAPTQGALSGAAAAACMELGRGELQVRAGVIWNAIRRTFASLGGASTPSVLEDLQQQMAQYLTEEARTVANITSEHWRANAGLFAFVRDSIGVECRNELRERYNVEAKFYVDSLKRPAPSGATPAVLNFNAPVGAVHTGAYATSHVVLSTGDSERLIQVLETFGRSVQANTEMSSEQQAFSLELVSDLVVAAKSEKPNTAKVSGLLSGLGQTVETVASLQDAWDTVKSVGIAVGVWFSNL